MRLRVAVNATSLLSPFTGVAQYTRNLMGKLVTRPECEFFFFYGLGWGRKLRSKPVPRMRETKSLARFLVPRAHDLWRFVQQARFRSISALRVDLYHEPNFFPFHGAPVIVTTIHDLSPLRFPETHLPSSVRRVRRLLPRAIENSRFLITDSEFVRRELISEFGVSEEKVRAIPLGVGPEFRVRTAEETAAALRTFGLARREFALTVGTIEPRKNLLQALRAYSALPKALAQRYPLVVAGMKGWLVEPIEAEISRLAAEGRVRNLGFVPAEALACLYCGARAFIYPSIYEGFGLPPLEAMASGTPVVVSNRASLPEVVGDAGLQVDPENLDELRAGIEILLEDDMRSAELSRRGIERARQFTWEKCADMTLEVYRAALQ